MTLALDTGPAVDARGKPRRTMSYDEFLHAEFDHNHYEWVDGEAVEQPVIELQHELIVKFLTVALGMMVSIRKLGLILGEPFQMQAETDGNGRSPDLIFIANESRHLLEHLTMRGPADLVIEVASPSTEYVDRGAKLREYERAGVPEYWTINAERQRAEFRQLGEDGRYRLVAPDADGVYHCRVMPGVWVRPEWFWDLPEPQDVLKLWGVL